MISKQAAGDRDGWETISSQTHFESAHLRVVTEEVRSPAREQPRSWTVVHRKAAVVVAPMTADGKLVLIRQERIPIRAAIWEVPAGQIDEGRDGGMPEAGSDCPARIARRNRLRAQRRRGAHAAGIFLLVRGIHG